VCDENWTPLRSPESACKLLILRRARRYFPALWTRRKAGRNCADWDGPSALELVSAGKYASWAPGSGKLRTGRTCKSYLAPFDCKARGADLRFRVWGF
jgi:hypothetical protein